MLRIQGYTNMDSVRPRIRKIAQSMATLAETTFVPEIRFLSARIESCIDGRLTLANRIVFYSRAFTKFLAGCDEVVAFVLTMGHPVDEHLAALQSEDKLVEAVFLETASWLGLETLTKQLSQALRQQAALNGKSITRRLSPGYSFEIEGVTEEWSLYEQKELFSLFAGHDLPVKILESCAMLPKMSRSGLYGMRQVAGFSTDPRS